ncbi:MAG: DUF1287 domain-containing protein [Bacillota bacterium]|nr:DUF1287 domain-containing protein [Bacillota bacterium]
MKIITLDRKALTRMLLVLVGIGLLLALCLSFNNIRYLFIHHRFNGLEEMPPSPVELIAAENRITPDFILLGARQEAQNQTRYDGSYQVMAYPGGDVSQDVGACTDVIIRAYRNAGIDLQKFIHEDMQENFSEYPDKWGLTAPDPNIDHRRIPNQMKFFERNGTMLTTNVEQKTEEWQWGDTVYWKFPNGDEHCGIISDRHAPDGTPLVIHNAGMAVEQDFLQRWKIIGHFRYYGE